MKPTGVSRSRTRFWLAVLLLATGATVCAVAIHGQLESVPAAGPGGDAGDGEAPPRGPIAGPGGRPHVDLLAHHGSYQPGTPVAAVFALNSAAALPAAPPSGGPTTSADPMPGVRAPDPAPPAMSVSLILLSGASARAVVDGKVVGMGDQVEAGVIRRIAADGIEVVARGRSYFYEIQRLQPRGQSPAAGPEDERGRQR